MIPPTSIDGTDITGATIDGTDVQEITVDGQTVFTAGPQLPTTNLIHHYDFSAPSTTTTFVEDLAGPDDLTSGQFSGFGTINGLDAGNFQDNVIESNWSQSVSEPLSYVVVCKTDNTDGQIIIDGKNNNFIPIFWSNAQVWRWFRGSNTDFNSTPLPDQANYLTAVAETSSTVSFYANGIDQGTKSSGSTLPVGITIGDLTDRDVGLEMFGLVGEVLVYDSNLSSNPARADVEAYISNKWGL